MLGYLVGGLVLEGTILSYNNEVLLLNLVCCGLCFLHFNIIVDLVVTQITLTSIVLVRTFLILIFSNFASDSFVLGSSFEGDFVLSLCL